MYFSDKNIFYAGIGIAILLCFSVPAVLAGPSDNWFPDNQWIEQITGTHNQNTIQVSEEHATDRLIVRYNPNSAQSRSSLMSVQSSANAMAGTQVVRDLSSNGVAGMQVVQVSGTSLENAMAAYKANPDVLYVEPDYKISLSPIENVQKTVPIQSFQASGSSYPNDPGYSNLWGLQNTGQAPFYGTPGADMKAPLAWTKTTGSSGVTVAVIDTGVDYSHPDLAANIWQNSGESINGVDDDGNGYIDDVRGWNFVSKNNDPMDDNGHGTHCAGTIAAVGNNGIGIAGVTWKTKIMPLKFLDSRGSGYTSDAISAILYANKMGVPIISNSWSGTGYSQSLKDAIDASQAVIICAAGNSGGSSEINPIYPAAYTSSNIISVAATNYHDALASFSNYGASSVDLAAPGVSIYSTTKSGGYSYLNGTSMAAPYVTGVAALLKSQSPSLTGAQIKSKILGSCDNLPSLSGKVATGGRLNAAKALGISTPTPTPTNPVPTPTVTRTPTPVPTSTPIPTPTVTRPPTPVPTSTPVPTPTVTRPPTPVPTSTPVPTPTVTRPPTPVPTSTPIPTPTVTRTPTPVPTIVPDSPPLPPTPCGVYKTDTQTGFLKQGQAAVYGYFIPSDGRSKIEWSEQTFGTCGSGKGLNNQGMGSIRENNNACADTSVFDIYVCKDCNPKNSYCYAQYYATGQNPYISITPPNSGSTYFVMIYARTGNGYYTLKMNSYKCPGNTPIIVASKDSGIFPSGKEIPVPSAEYIPQ
ncbi:S8 family serine peptidase [Methanospirillum purgamenti]|uniref:S8 family serine peptidase n=1 Tax=Methanospirillum hungatei TaxID=2203 RepID=A0A8F5ZF55_METHU|nr:S8 family peptidase [Methanospirillum hungatei]QXO95517.1 S8 family serine peptidase [Methanospirillum hungatei]